MVFKPGTKIKVFQIIVKLIFQGFGVNVAFDSIGILRFNQAFGFFQIKCKGVFKLKNVSDPKNQNISF